MSAPVVSVLVPVLDEEAHIRETASRMRAQRLDGEAEFLFVDGRSTDRTRAILEELAAEDPRIRVLDNPRRQTAAALNIALRAARAPVVARMDAHTFYPEDYLAQGLARLRRGDVVWVSGAQLPHPVDRGSRRVARALESRLGTGGANFRFAGAEELEARTGFTGVFDRAFLEGLGGWDDGWPVNQDAELGARVAAAGGRMVIIPAMAAGYVPRSTLRGLARQYRRYGFYRAKTCRRHPHSMRISHLVPPATTLVLAGALVAPRGARGPLRVAAAGYAAAVTAETVRAALRGDARDAVGLPAVFATMHLSWGAGFLAGCVRWGPPWRGALRALVSSLRR